MLTHLQLREPSLHFRQLVLSAYSARLAPEEKISEL